MYRELVLHIPSYQACPTYISFQLSSTCGTVQAVSEHEGSCGVAPGRSR